jgi:hypothetical protein
VSLLEFLGILSIRIYLVHHILTSGYSGHVPITAYGLCVVEFAERASFIGVKQVFSNFVNRPLPVGGNGAGAPRRGTQQTAGALGKGTVVAAAVTSSFGFLTYALVSSSNEDKDVC